MEKINVAELLKDCPKGMELDCIMLEGSVVFEDISDDEEYPIGINLKNGDYTNLTKYGQYLNLEEAKCVIFPKGKTTWEGFQRPFKDGDVVTSVFQGAVQGTGIFDYEEQSEAWIHVCINLNNEFSTDGYLGHVYDLRLATEEEKAKLFKSIRDNGYKWNPETKTLEKLIEPKFNVGDKIKRKGDTRLTTIKDIRDNYYIITIPDFFDNAYITDKLLFSNQNEYEIVPNKFDIATLKPFDKVLVRGDVGQKWTHDFFGFIDKDKGYPFVCVGHYVIQCIPYEGNEHLLGKVDDCDEYFKTWK